MSKYEHIVLFDQLIYKSFSFFIRRTSYNVMSEPNKPRSVLLGGARAKIAGLLFGVVEVNESPLGRESTTTICPVISLLAGNLG